MIIYTKSTYMEPRQALYFVPYLDKHSSLHGIIDTKLIFQSDFISIIDIDKNAHKVMKNRYEPLDSMWNSGTLLSRIRDEIQIGSETEGAAYSYSRKFKYSNKFDISLCENFEEYIKALYEIHRNF
ncbi:hypothetical protein pEaSNUABM50_00092 [Erwinia phage pEa_SNUABM_50]|uniref:Uncharacterized protein n=4 Tax=Eneladusvirus BF TaxID=2560751 RepID=A0A7L8ZMT5_9CAUD|nr:hypothetical protein FDH34_gp094 [Serratia phage BF]QOI71032.1 hypothetical protein pEaSNUABM12_00094 [Erwinia phage pEa_SNUABM_12]QOI71577.1 hypothetical protein pEaSNUABM47_00093 [Erwinia phage pEa_SNUABM_47]QOI72116.1 hypothetical protein pEaSNUABM50_00092 [Erwinia phage pEa_SNUABM_50]QXO11241.1 hypothetical protein pEaSNUABM19_00095 [Erwinia phage pEa_SNUABM_19]QXO11789.1 hypothetical protein pEaSNUABM44_00093 [Erwinia phage pEa_SNUABM_44]QXO12341.1 hypothetical protein pEaSNUABM49_000